MKKTVKACEEHRLRDLLREERGEIVGCSSWEYWWIISVKWEIFFNSFLANWYPRIQPYHINCFSFFEFFMPHWSYQWIGRCTFYRISPKEDAHFTAYPLKICSFITEKLTFLLVHSYNLKQNSYQDPYLEESVSCLQSE